MLTGCGTGAEARLDAAAAQAGAAQADTRPPPWPDDCRRQEPHAPLVAGAEVRSVLRRERAALDRQNERTARCAVHYDTVVMGPR